mgnify:FL=1
MTEPKYIVEIDGLRKSYPRVDALDGIDLKIEAGKIWGLLGPNGSGKSTLLKCIAGLVQPDSGRVTIHGLKPSWKTKTRIAFVPEIDHLYRWMTVKETLDYYAAFYQDWQREKEQELLEFMHLDPQKKVGALSKGMRSRLKLIIGLARNAELLLLDEPLSGIDVSSRDRIVEGIVRQFRSEKQTLILSTHAIDETERLFDSVIFLSEGKVYLSGDAEELRVKYSKSMNELFKEVYA